MPGALQAAQHEQLDQVAEVQAGRGRVEPAVDGDRSGGTPRPGPSDRWASRRGRGRSARAAPVRYVERGCHLRELIGGWHRAAVARTRVQSCRSPPTDRHARPRRAAPRAPPVGRTPSRGRRSGTARAGRRRRPRRPAGPASTGDRGTVAEPRTPSGGPGAKVAAGRGPVSAEHEARPAGPRARSADGGLAVGACSGDVQSVDHLAGPQQHRRAAPSGPVTMLAHQCMP